MTTKEALDHLRNELSKDKAEGSYYYTWQSNIAMAFVDAYNQEWKDINEYKEGVPGKHHIPKVANDAAKNFLDNLINQ